MLKITIKLLIGTGLCAIGFVNPGLWPWLIFCLVGGGLIGSTLADIQSM